MVTINFAEIERQQNEVKENIRKAVDSDNVSRLNITITGTGTPNLLDYLFDHCQVNSVDFAELSVYNDRCDIELNLQCGLHHLQRYGEVEG